MTNYYFTNYLYSTNILELQQAFLFSAERRGTGTQNSPEQPGSVVGRVASGKHSLFDVAGRKQTENMTEPGCV